jgi:pyridoxine 5-phosphate synthase
VRNTRHLGIPSVVRAARCACRPAPTASRCIRGPTRATSAATTCRAAGAAGHGLAGAEFNIEGNPFHNLMDFVRDCGRTRHLRAGQRRPVHQRPRLGPSRPTPSACGPLIAEAKALGVRVSLFMDPRARAMAAAKAVGADRVELYTESYAAPGHAAGQAQVLRRFAAAAQAAQAAGLGVNAGHDLNRDNLTDFLRAVPGRAGGLDRPRLHRRCAGARLRRDGAAYLACIDAAFAAVRA